MQNHKIETNSELIREDGSIWSNLIFIKIIGSDTLWYPLPPSERAPQNKETYKKKYTHTMWAITNNVETTTESPT